MTGKDHKRVDEHENAALDRELDAALAKYASAEPRAGIEERVLANLRAERTRVADRSWWRWGVAAATAAAVIAVAVAVISNFARPSRPANPPLATTLHLSNPGTQMANHHIEIVGRRGGGPVRRMNRHPAHSTMVAAAPKLDQFPSPQPLSEQERILASYVSEYPEHAVLIARARMEMLRRDREEELREEGEDSKGNSQANERN